MSLATENLHHIVIFLSLGFIGSSISGLTSGLNSRFTFGHTTVFYIFKTKVDSDSWLCWFDLDTYVWVIGGCFIFASFSNRSSTWSNDILDVGMYKMVFLLVLYQFGFPHHPLVSFARILESFKIVPMCLKF